MNIRYPIYEGVYRILTVDFHFFPFHRSSDTLPFTKCKHFKTARTDIPIEQEIHHNKFHFPQNRFI